MRPEQLGETQKRQKSTVFWEKIEKYEEKNYLCEEEIKNEKKNFFRRKKSTFMFMT